MNSLPAIPSATLTRRAAGLALGGLVVLLMTAAVSRDRAWANLLLVAYALVTLGLGGALFLALTNVCDATWHVAFRRVPEALAGLLPMAGLLMLATLALGLSRYTWPSPGEHVAETFWFKELWLSPRFFALRAVTYVLLWILLSRALVGSSRRQDAAFAPTRMPGSTLRSVVFLAVFAITISLAGVDWIMALEPLWFSTMWGVYQFSGLFLSALAGIVIACIWLRRAGPLAGVFTDEHLHDLGKLLLGFSCFWMYIWFCQYMLIWYSNIPEETSYFIPRIKGPWGPVVVGSLALNWVIPFFMLLPRPSKRSESMMLRVGVVVLIGRFVDLAVMIFPSVTGTPPVFGLPELASVALVVGLATWMFVRAFSGASPVPQRDPDLAASLHYHA